ncbi:SubName: Full=Uncharacterized protein {ECO:0000313/EMBL:CCA68552.1} [Serendipita indica DSM 11827]|nr:SubName: Full=Uncharacterized protein {ECO:0000313/EMBL:CCA68552.1} [Serendipita indica DSM 11827]
MSIRTPSRPTTPAASIKGLSIGPFRTPRSRPSKSLPNTVFGDNNDDQLSIRAGKFARSHRRTASTSAALVGSSQHDGGPPSSAPPFGSTFPPVAGAHYFQQQGTRPSFRSSLQSLARTGSLSRIKSAGRHTRNTSTDGHHPADYWDDVDNQSNGSRFDLLDSDPFRSESPAPVDHYISEIEETPPPVPPKPFLSFQKPEAINTRSPGGSEGSRTPTSATVAAMKNAFSRLTGSNHTSPTIGASGKPRKRLLSFIREAKTPVVPEPPAKDTPQLTLPTLDDGPLFDAANFELDDFAFARSPKANRKSNTLSFPVAQSPSPPQAPISIAELQSPSALQLNLHGDLASYIIPSPTRDDEGDEDEAPTPVATTSQLRIPQGREEKEVVSSLVPPAWILEFREELEKLAGEALNLTSLPDNRLVLELPEAPGSSHRRTLVFEDVSSRHSIPTIPEIEETPVLRTTGPTEEETTPALTYDSASITSTSTCSRGTPKRPTRPIPPVPPAFVSVNTSNRSRQRGGSVSSRVADTATLNLETRPHLEAHRTSPPGSSRHITRSPAFRVESLYTIQSRSTQFDPDQHTIPSIPDQDSYFVRAPTSDSEFDSDTEEGNSVYQSLENIDEDRIGDDQTIRAALALASEGPQSNQEAPQELEANSAPAFQPRISKQEAIEEAIQKIQRKAELQSTNVRLGTTEEEQLEEPEVEEEPADAKSTVTNLLRSVSNPFSTSTEEPPKPPRKVSLLRKRVLSRSLGAYKPSLKSSSSSTHSRSTSEPNNSKHNSFSSSLFGEEKRIIVAGHLPLTTRQPERPLQSILQPSSSFGNGYSYNQHRQYPHHAQYHTYRGHPDQPPAFYDDYYSPPVYLATSTPTFEVLPPAVIKRHDTGSASSAIPYPVVEPTPLTPSYSTHKTPGTRQDELFVEL